VAFPPEALRARCEEILGRYPTRQAACIPILHLAQRHFGGWVSPEVEAGVAEYLGVSDSHIRGLLTFYAMFNSQPAGRHEVWVCRTLTCWLHGAEDLRRVALEKAGAAEPGVVGPDGRFLVKNMECLGLCEHAPAVFVDGKPHVKVTREKLVDLMDACE
jgi:NADH-quinone oxidoreductase subunit E